jgi:hypothetical protein
MDEKRKHWNEQQKEMERALARPVDHQAAIALCLSQHAMVHASDMSGSGLWSFDDELWDGLSENAARRIPPNGVHSIGWMMWHTARCEDITMNLLVAGSPQVLLSGGWLEKMKVSICDTGNAMTVDEIRAYSAAVDIAAIRAYRTAVGRRTREIIQQIQPGSLKQKVAPARIQQVWAEGAVVEAARWLTDYWGSRTIAGLLKMPATRHNMVHLNEAMRIKPSTNKKNE